MKSKNILLLDVDYTIIIPKDNFIYKKIKNKEIPLTPSEYSKESEEDLKRYKYDFRDFEEPQKIYESFAGGKPIVKVLNFMRSKVDKGWEVGILTARARASIIKKFLRSWMYINNERGETVIIGSHLKKVYAVGKVGRNCNTANKKKEVLKKLSKSYNNVLFIDDDQKNIDAANSLKIKNLTAINTATI